jgi:hypothetical protein
MKQHLHKLISVLLSLVVLFSTFSFTVESHYCGERLVDIAVFSEVDGCGMEILSSSGGVQGIAKKSCCRNEIDFVKGNSIDQQAFQKNILPHVYFVVALLILYEDLFAFSIETAHYQYKPPLIDRDITILFENFRI